jgi:hypothetical protein
MYVLTVFPACLIHVGEDAEAELLGESGDHLVIVADDEGDVGAVVKRDERLRRGGAEIY